MNCPDCRGACRDGVRFCTTCGAPLFLFCPRCQFPTQPEDRYCGGCGLRLSAPASGLRPMASSAGLPGPGGASQPSEASLESERKNVTVLFADISGFTAMSEKLDPEEVTNLMNGCMKQLADIVVRYEGHVDKFIGDCIMAIFGAPVAHENDPELAIRAAIDMNKAMEEYNKTLPIKLEKPLTLHTGINTGMVIAGGMGSDQKMQYTVMGDTVNLASRLESLATSGQILVSSYTYNLTRQNFEFAGQDPIKVKGKKDPVAVYQVLKVRNRPLQEKKSDDAPPLVGRDLEVRAIGECYTRFRKGEGQVLFLISDPGIGKSRIQDECAKQFKEVEVQNVNGTCRSFHCCTTYSLFVELFRSLFGVDSDDVAETAARKAAANIPLLLQLPPDNLGQEAREAIVFIGWILGGDLSAEYDIPLADMPGQEVKVATFRAVAWFFEKLAALKPLVLTLEDLHYADNASVELIAHIMRLVRASPLLLTLLLRPNKEHPSYRLLPIARKALDRQCVEITFHHLSGDDSDRLARCLLKSEQVPDAVLKLIRERSEGNPLYIGEIVRNLRDEGVVEEGAGGELRVVKDLESVSIPDSLNGMISARIDRLPPHLKEVLSVAAVMGSVFRLELLRRLVRQPNLDELLEKLSDAEMIFESQSFPEVEYSFRNVLIQESVYNTMLLKKRKALHAQVANELEAMAGNSALEEQADLLGLHYHLAEEWAKAYPFLLESGLKAKRAFANEEAARILGRALEAATHLKNPKPPLAELLVHLSEVEEMMGEMQEAIRYREEAIVATTDPRRQADFKRNIGRIQEKRGFKDEAMKVYGEAAELLKQHPDSLEMGQLLMNESWVLNRMRQFKEAMEKAQAALAIFQAHDSRTDIALVYNNLAVFCEHQGDLDQALEHNRKSLELFTQLGDKRQMANLYLSLGYVHNSRKEFEEALAYFSKSAELMERIGNRYGAGTALMAKGRIYMDTQRLDEGESTLTQSLRLHQDLDLKKKVVANELALAKLYMMKGVPQEARAHLDGARSEAVAQEYTSDLAKIHHMDGQLRAANGENPEEVWGKALALYQQLDRKKDAELVEKDLAAWRKGSKKKG